jgi:hypothetical protein
MLLAIYMVPRSFSLQLREGLSTTTFFCQILHLLQFPSDPEF